MYNVSDLLNKMSLRLYNKSTISSTDPNCNSLLGFLNDAIQELSFNQNWTFLRRNEQVKGYIISATEYAEDFSGRVSGSLSQTPIIPINNLGTFTTTLPFSPTIDIMELKYLWLPVIKGAGIGAVSGRIKLDICDNSDKVLYNFSDYLIYNDYVYDVYNNYQIKYYLGSTIFAQSLYFFPVKSTIPIILQKGKIYKLKITSSSFMTTQRALNCYLNTTPTNEYITTYEYNSDLITADPFYLLSSLVFYACDYTNTFYIKEANKKVIEYISPGNSETWDNVSSIGYKIKEKPEEKRGFDTAFMTDVLNDSPYYFSIIDYSNDKYLIKIEGPNAPIWFIYYKYIPSNYAYSDKIDLPYIFLECALLKAEINCRMTGHGLVDNINLLTQKYLERYEELCRLYGDVPDNIMG